MTIKISKDFSDTITKIITKDLPPEGESADEGLMSAIRQQRTKDKEKRKVERGERDSIKSYREKLMKDRLHFRKTMKGHRVKFFRKEEEEKEIKLSGKKEKVKINPEVDEDLALNAKQAKASVDKKFRHRAASVRRFGKKFKKEELDGYAMGANPFQRAIQKDKPQDLNEVFQHTWGYGTPEEENYRTEWNETLNNIVAEEDPNQYVDPLQVKIMYSAGASPQDAANRIFGYPVTKNKESHHSRERRYSLVGVSGKDSEYEDENEWNGEAN